MAGLGYNPNRDPKTGEFTSAGGESVGGHQISRTKTTGKYVGIKHKLPPVQEARARQLFESSRGDPYRPRTMALARMVSVSARQTRAAGLLKHRAEVARIMKANR